MEDEADVREVVEQYVATHGVQALARLMERAVEARARQDRLSKRARLDIYRAAKTILAARSEQARGRLLRAESRRLRDR
jgi:predicted nuclease of restriction endonuclease-like RecB superfamily